MDPWVVSVFEQHHELMALVVMPALVASELLEDPDLAVRAPRAVADAVARDLERLPDGAPEGLAAVALRLAIELENPGHSGAAKASLAGQLREALDRLAKTAPVEKEASALDDLAARRAARRSAGGAGT